MTAYADGALTLSVDGEVATLAFDRPAKRNAITLAMWRALPEACVAFTASDAKVLVVTGRGGHFAAGADIGEFEAVYATPQSAADYNAAIAAGIGAIAGLEKPVIAAIEGACVGGGLAVALACDLRIAAPNARLAITPAKLGLTYSLEDTKRLVDAVGASAARDILFTGRLLGADEALRLALVDAVEADIQTAVATKAAEIAAASQRSVRAIKATIRAILSGAVEDDAATRAAFVASVTSPDFIEGRSAFLEKRKAVFPER
ncbi:enoyl-CoA hydratase [Caulobacter flavus]|uniref:Enoyl-CoA hydratase n=1 Tax=Caulobacter flavus TaxID=1679497 RepID=A0A2N5CLA4_9CAUL|nr:enoyl-CoA hydratase-related protein [Caulobacter flavus]AYV48329.1 enoyl-CoA hydratase [Caulobacter flavus]PLR06489.1 enoyl-CoA hydratase [Caulobacter flavus]